METNRTRTNRELLRIMLKHQDLFNSGLCDWVWRMYDKDLITNIEYSNLRVYIRRNKPFSLRLLLIKYAYYWKKGDIKPRIKWINKHIKKLKL